MTKGWLGAVLLAALAAAPPAAAQSVGEDLEWALEHIVFIWVAPTRIQSADLVPIGGVLAATAGAVLVDGAVADWLRENDGSAVARTLEPFGNESPVNAIGRTLVLQGLSVALYGIGHATESSDLREAAIGCAAANLSTTTSRFVFANLIGRLRPRYDGGPFVIEPFAFGDWSMRSFFGGHAANIMSCASFWNHRFDMGLAEPALYALAGAVGLARVVDEAHWLSDTLVGIVYGIAIGKGIAARSRSRSRDSTAEQFAPALRLGWQIRF